MGGCVSCKILSSSTSKSPKPKPQNIIRIVHMNGYVEQLHYPATVGEITGNPPKQFLFTHDQLLSNMSTPLRPHTHLEQGKIYFLLPYSVFKANVSPIDLAPLTRKLASMAQDCNRSKSNSNYLSSPTNSPSRIDQSSNVDVKMENDQAGIRKSSKSRSWKPILDTIREKSFNRRSESELLQENAKVDDI